MTAGKTKEFAEAVLQYFADGEALPGHTGLYVALVSGVPTGTPPYDGLAVSQKECLPGTYRAPLGTEKLSSLTKAGGTISITNDGVDPIVDFGVAPSAMDVSGYALTLSQTSTAASAYIAYEIFDVAIAKQRKVNQSDTVKINESGLVIKEK